MLKVDAFALIVPPKYKNYVQRKVDAALPPLGHLAALPALFDLDKRFRVMDRFPDVMHLLVHEAPIPSDITGPREALELSMRLNDELAELVQKHPDRFAGAVAVVPLNDMDAALKELERAINDLHLQGVLIRVPINGKPPDWPEFKPLYEAMTGYDLPIWIHPQRASAISDYSAEGGGSRFLIWTVWGFIFETTVAMTRLVFGGVLQEYPNLKFIVHHGGAMIPYFSGRIQHAYDLAERILGPEVSYKRGLDKEPIEYFRMFYSDTVVHGNIASLMCAHDLFGAGHLLFGTDFPFDLEMGAIETRETIEAIERMPIAEQEKNNIFAANVKNLCRLPV